MALSKGAQVETEQRLCKKQNKVTEHRRYKIERKWATNKETGERFQTNEYRYQWRCHECQTASDTKSKKARGVNVGRNKRAREAKAAAEAKVTSETKASVSVS